MGPRGEAAGEGEGGGGSGASLAFSSLGRGATRGRGSDREGAGRGGSAKGCTRQSSESSRLDSILASSGGQEGRSSRRRRVC